MAARLVAIAALFCTLSSCGGGSSESCCPAPVTGTAATGSYVLVGGQPAPATMTDIAVSVDKLGRTSFTLAFDVSVAGRNAARAKIVVVCLDRATEKPAPIPEKLRAALCA